MSCNFKRGRLNSKSKRVLSLIGKMLEDDELVKLIYFNTDTPLDEVFQEGFDKINELRFKKIYNQPYEPPTDTATTIVCIYPRRGSMSGGNTNYKKMDIYVDIIVHRDKCNIEIDGSTEMRAFEIGDRIDLIMNGEYGTDSLSKDWFSTFENMPVTSLYGMLRLIYQNVD